MFTWISYRLPTYLLFSFLNEVPKIFSQYLASIISCLISVSLLSATLKGITHILGFKEYCKGNVKQ